MSTPLVSIVMPTFNRARLLPRAVDSVRAQTFQNWEIILVDDGSTDDTLSVCKQYQRELGDRFTYLTQANSGSSAARNRGIDAARGAFVAFLDSDDEFLPPKLERQLGLFRARPELGIVYGDSSYVDLDGARHPSVFDTKAPQARRVPFQEIAPGLCVCDQRFFSHLLTDYFVSTISGVVRRDVLGDSIRFPVGYAYAEEWMFYLRVARACGAGFVNEPLCLHHFTQGSLSRRSAEENLAQRLRLLELMRDEFGGDGRKVRSIIRRHLAGAHEQLAFAAYRRGQFAEASAEFRQSFGFRPRVATLIHALQAGWNGWRRRTGGPAARAQPPVAPDWAGSGRAG